MIEKYLDFCCGCLDKCKDCQGIPFIKQNGNKPQFTVECDCCMKEVGPYESRGEAMVEWNKEQRNKEDK